MRNNGHVTTLSKNCNCGIPELHCLDQNPCLGTTTGKTNLVQELDTHVDDLHNRGHRPPRRRKHTQQETQPAPPRRHRRRNPATATPRPPPTPFPRACLKNSSLGSFMMNSAGASTPEPVRPPTTRARPCRATSLAPGEVGGQRRRSR